MRVRICIGREWEKPKMKRRARCFALDDRKLCRKRLRSFGETTKRQERCIRLQEFWRNHQAAGTCERFGKTTKLEERCIRRRLVRERFGESTKLEERCIRFRRFGESTRRKERCIRLRLGSKKRRRIGERCKFRLVLYATPVATAVSARLVSPSTKGGEPFVAGARPV